MIISYGSKCYIMSRGAEQVIPWIEDDNGLYGAEWWVKRTLDYGRNATRLNSDGFIGIHWRTRAHAPEFAALASFPWLNESRASVISAADIYTDIAINEFGLSEEDAAAAAELMATCDKHWNHSGPIMGDYSVQPSYANGCRPMDGWSQPVGGKIPPQWYAWVDNFARLGSKVVGTENRERYNYYNLTYHWLKAEAADKLHRTYATRRTLIQLAQQLVYTRGGIGQLSGMHARLGPPLIPPGPTVPVKCGIAPEGTTLSLGCPSGELIEEVIFASYGLATGSCSTGFAVKSSCNAPNASSVVAKQCVGKTNCSVSATVTQFGMDPCKGVTKHLSVDIRCTGDPPPLRDVLQAWQCEEQMSKLRLHQRFGITSDGRIHRPPSIGVDLCVQPERTSVSGARLFAGDCRSKSAAFSVADGHIKHTESGLCISLMRGNTTSGTPVVLASCVESTAAWSVDTVVNQPTFTSMAASNLCLDIGSAPSVGPAPPSVSRSVFLGDDRLLIIAPRGHVRKREGMAVTAMAFLHKIWNASLEPPPSLMLRSLNASSTATAGWMAVPMAAVVPDRHVFRAEVPSSICTGDFEYYARLRNLTFPTAGAIASITVVVV
jgi:hypothetical protein